MDQGSQTLYYKFYSEYIRIRITEEEYFAMKSQYQKFASWDQKDKYMKNVVGLHFNYIFKDVYGVHSPYPDSGK